MRKRPTELYDMVKIEGKDAERVAGADVIAYPDARFVQRQRIDRYAFDHKFLPSDRQHHTPVTWLQPADCSA